MLPCLVYISDFFFFFIPSVDEAARTIRSPSTPFIDILHEYITLLNNKLQTSFHSLHRATARDERGENEYNGKLYIYIERQSPPIIIILEKSNLFFSVQTPIGRVSMTSFFFSIIFCCCCAEWKEARRRRRTSFNRVPVLTALDTPRRAPPSHWCVFVCVGERVWQRDRIN